MSESQRSLDKVPDTDPAPSAQSTDVIADLASSETRKLLDETADAQSKLRDATDAAVKRVYGAPVVKFANLLHEIRARVDQIVELEAEAVKAIEAAGAIAPTEVNFYVQTVRVGVDYLDTMTKRMGL